MRVACTLVAAAVPWLAFLVFIWSGKDLGNEVFMAFFTAAISVTSAFGVHRFAKPLEISAAEAEILGGYRRFSLDAASILLKDGTSIFLSDDGSWYASSFVDQPHRTALSAYRAHARRRELIKRDLQEDLEFAYRHTE